MSGNNISRVSKDQCTGCGACKAVCPKNAISFQPDKEGFPSPVIDDEKCILCGLCENVCPELHMPKTSPVDAAFAAQLLDRDILKISTSGGIFTALSREIFRRGGVVYGCVWDADYNAVICKAENEEEIKPMYGSKYVWSWAGDAFVEIKKHLDNGRTVMFTGMPCQAAGLKNFLRKDYENLYLVCFLCGGAPSPFAFHEYLKTITKKIPLDKLDFKLRDKERHGVGVHISYNTPKGRIYQSYIRNPYYFSFNTKIFNRRSCYHCRYRYKQRVDDLTFGDFWGVGNYHSEFDIRAGVSALLINSKKGEELLESIKKYIFVSKTDVHHVAKENNLTLSDKTVSFSIPEFRNDFFKILKTDGWTAAEKKYLYNRVRFKLWVMNTLPIRGIKKIMKIIKRKIR